MQIKYFLETKLKEFYKNNFISVDKVKQREFGYGIFGRKIANRNLSFNSEVELNDFLRNKIPFYFSYSAAYYKFPGEKLNKKQYLGGDLVFEFDADDIPTNCKKIHDSWECPHCGAKGKGNIRKCPECGKPVKIDEWICDNCIKATKKQTKRLYFLLQSHFGFKDDEISIMFSGHKGFHIKIKSQKVYDLKQHQRIEIMNYVSEDGLNFNSLGFVPDNRGSIKYVGPNFGKGFDYLNNIIFALKNYDLDNLVLLFESTPRTIKKIIEKKTKVIEDLKKGIFYKPKVDSTDLWYNLLENIKLKNKIYIDKQTTIDIKKIVRLDNTIHGGSMLVAKKIDINKINDFNPFEDASPFKTGYLKIRLKKVPKLLLNKEIIGPYENEVVELKQNMALYFLAKGVADEIII